MLLFFEVVFVVFYVIVIVVCIAAASTRVVDVAAIRPAVVFAVAIYLLLQIINCCYCYR